MQNTRGVWRQTPPAIFPPILGLFGLGLAWRQASAVFPVPRDVGEVILGAVSLLFLFGVLAYVGKITRRPSALIDDLRIMPGRAGISAGSVSAMLFAATMVPYWRCLAVGAVSLALLVHLVMAMVILWILWPAPLPQRRMTPVWHLSFVGFIVAPLAAVPVGWTDLSELIFVITLPLAVTIWGGSLVLLSRNAVPPPLRPPLAIHLAPVCLFGIVSSLLGFSGLAVMFGWIAIAGMAILAMRVKYLTAAGFSPFWGAFTFPIAAFANLMLILAQSEAGVFRIISGIALIAATLSIPIIAFKIIKMWSAGSLATKTNASRV